METFLWILLGVLGVVIFLGILPVMVMSSVLYKILLVRDKKDKWGREISEDGDEEYRRMYDIGFAWEKEFRDKKSEVTVTSDNLRLVGEYFDFGADKAVIIIPGRTESLLYSYFFAAPYQKSGYNVLVIDNRSHGLSEGKYVSFGFKEYRDIIKWSELLHEKGNEKIVLHGICIGASVALFALTAKTCPDYLVGMVSEGMYTTFYESFKNHMIELGKPVFPICLGTMTHVLLYSGANVITDGPIKRISLLKKPILFLHSKQDVFSKPDKAQILFDKCESDKKLVWFDKGEHSRIRINNMQEYDDEIVAFLNKF